MTGAAVGWRLVQTCARKHEPRKSQAVVCGQNVKRDVKGIFHACQVGSGLKRSECVRGMGWLGTPETTHTYIERASSHLLAVC